MEYQGMLYSLSSAIKYKFFDLKKRYGKKLLILITDLCLVNLALLIAFLLRLDPYFALIKVKNAFPIHFIIVSGCYLVSFIWFKTYRTIIRLASFHTAIKFCKAVFFAGGLHYIASLILIYDNPLPRSLYFITGLVIIPISLLVKFSFRIYDSMTAKQSGDQAETTLIYGAGINTNNSMDSLLKNSNQFNIVGLLDDNPSKKGSDIQGKKVLGSEKDLEDIVKKHGVKLVIISMPSISGQKTRRITKLLNGLNVEVKILPPPEVSLHNTNSISNSIRELQIDDLLKRTPREINKIKIKSMILGKTVLVTGGGGSIGSELVRQVASFKPLKLIVNDSSEFSLYNLGEEVEKNFPDVEFRFHLGNLSINSVAQNLFQSEKIDFVFHACAYKHVPIVEENISSAFLNNVLSSDNVFYYARETFVDKVIMVSTDKAVHPTNVMGATKRLSEMLAIWHSNQKNNRTKFNSVRFGNVLGSSGSVIPKFLSQITDGGPVTITHPEVTRYFMLIPEAVSLILQAATANNNGEIFILNMGNPIKLKDMVEDLINLCGKKIKDDIEIKYVGLRKGEKLFEELNFHSETIEKVSEDFGKIICQPEFDENLNLKIQQLINIAKLGDDHLLKAELLKLIDRTELSMISNRAGAISENIANENSPIIKPSTANM